MQQALALVLLAAKLLAVSTAPSAGGPTRLQSQTAHPVGNSAPSHYRTGVMVAQAVAATRSKIQEMQMTLAALGYGVGEADGIMGSRTRTALLAFQKAYGVPQTGTLDDPTRRALVRAQNGAMEQLTPVEDIEAPRAVQAYHFDLLPGELADVQGRLNAAGYDAGAPDGTTTDQTRRALASFQRDRGLPVSGLVGPETMEVLQAVTTLSSDGGTGGRLEVPIIESGGDGQAASCMSSIVEGLSSDGDGFLAVRSGPGTSFPKIDELYNGDVVLIFEMRGDWAGAVYRTRDASCSSTVTQPVSHENRGWIHTRWLRPLAG